MALSCLLSWSSGKDCAFALHILRLRFPHIPVVALLTTFNETNSRVAMHATRFDIARAQAASVGLPLWRVDLPSPCSNAEYGRRMAALHVVARRHGITHVAFGDLHLRDVRAYREASLVGSSLTPLFPIWMDSSDGTSDDAANTTALAKRMLESGCSAMLCTVDAKKLASSFCGRVWDASCVDDLRSADADACGEKGEFHSIATDGPAFSSPLRLQVVGESFERGGFHYIDIGLVNGDSELGVVQVYLDALAIDAALEGDETAASFCARAVALGEALCPSSSKMAATSTPSPHEYSHLPLAIVSTVPAGTTIAFALGLGSSVRGVSHECKHPPEAALCPRVLTCTLDSDALTSLEIDTAVKIAGAQCGGGPPLYAVDTAVLASAGNGGKARVVVLAQDLCDVCGPAAPLVRAALDAAPPDASRTLVTLTATTLAGVYKDIASIADACNVTAAGDAFTEGLKARVAAVAESVAGKPLPRVVCLEWLEPLFNAGHWMPEVVRSAGGEECWSGPGFSQGLPPEALRDASPDIIVVMPCGFNAARTALDGAKLLPLLPGWAGIKAVKEGKVWCVDGNRLFSGASPALIEGIELLAILFHGTDEERAKIAPSDAVQLRC